MRKWILALALLCLAVPGHAEEKTAIVAYGLDLETLAFPPGGAALPDMAYCRTLGRGGDPFAPDYEVVGTFSQSGTTVTDDGATGAFTFLLPGDLLTFKAGDQTAGLAVPDVTVIITAWTSANQVTVAGGGTGTWGKMSYRISQCSDGVEMRQFPGVSPGEATTVTGGAWINVLNWESVLFTVKYQSGSLLNGLAFNFECRTRDDTLPGYSINAPTFGNQVYPGASSTCGFGTLNTDVCVLTSTEDTAPPGRAVDSKFSYQISHTQNFYECRIGLSCDDDCTGAATRINASITVSRQEVK